MTTKALYGELGYTFLKMDAFGTSLRPGAIRGILGYDVNPYFAIEGMAAGGVNDDNKGIAIGGVPSNVQAKMDYMYGIWVKPKYFYNQVRVFRSLRLGPHQGGNLAYGCAWRLRFRVPGRFCLGHGHELPVQPEHIRRHRLDALLEAERHPYRRPHAERRLALVRRCGGNAGPALPALVGAS